MSFYLCLMMFLHPLDPYVLVLNSSTAVSVMYWYNVAMYWFKLAKLLCIVDR